MRTPSTSKKTEIQRARAFSVDDTQKCPPDLGFEMVEIVSELDRAPEYLRYDARTEA
jgi:hypothetical protein